MNDKQKEAFEEILKVVEEDAAFFMDLAKRIEKRVDGVRTRMLKAKKLVDGEETT